MKHTPGPWTADEAPHWGQPGIEVRTPDGGINVRMIGASASCADFDQDGVAEYVPVVYDDGHTLYHEPNALATTLANARLIAAAPEMYEALRDMLAAYGDGSGDPVLLQAAHALAKAEGR